MHVEMASKDVSKSPQTGTTANTTANNGASNRAGSAIIKVSTESEVASREAEIAAALDRSNLYTSLGALLAAPATEEHCALLRELPEIEQPQSSMEMAWALLRKSAFDYTQDQINDEYHQLFIGLGRGVVVPYGSWHLTGFLMEKPLAQLRSDLRALGFERSEGVSETEDHIASLCQAMSAIIMADEIDFDTERSFFNEHIASWSEDFFKQVEDASCAGFYRAVANLGKSFIEVEKRYLTMSI